MGFFDWTQDREEFLELENRVARLEEQVARLSAALAAREGVMQPPDTATQPEVTTAAPASSAVASPPDFAEARALAAGGSKIAAIKLVRDQTGMGLRAAKDLVESWLVGGTGFAVVVRPGSVLGQGRFITLSGRTGPWPAEFTWPRTGSPTQRDEPSGVNPHPQPQPQAESQPSTESAEREAGPV